MLKKNRKAPYFEALNQDGELVTLKDFAGKKLALYFYPKDNTPGCTQQACGLRDSYAALTAKGVTIVGVSVDTHRKHKNFASKFDLPFMLLADTEHTMVNAYDVWGEKVFWGKPYMGIYRTTYLINEEGKIAHVIEQPDLENHAAQILETWHLV